MTVFGKNRAAYHLRKIVSKIIVAAKKPVIRAEKALPPIPMLFAGNHICVDDTMLTIVALVQLGVHVRPIVANDTIAPVEKILLEKICNVIWVNRLRNTNDEQAANFRRQAESEIVQTLVSGGSVMIRPAATYCPYLNEEPPYFAGAARIAAEASRQREAKRLPPVSLLPFVQEYDANGRFYIEVLEPLDFQNRDIYETTDLLHNIIEKNRPLLREKNGFTLSPEQYARMWRKRSADRAHSVDFTAGYQFLRGYSRAPEDYEAWWNKGDAFGTARNIY